MKSGANGGGTVDDSRSPGVSYGDGGRRSPVLQVSRVSVMHAPSRSGHLPGEVRMTMSTTTKVISNGELSIVQQAAILVQGAIDSY